MTVNPIHYAVHLHRKSDQALVWSFKPEHISVDWSWNRFGGCGRGTINLSTDIDTETIRKIAPDYDVRIYNPFARNDGLVYRGFIDSKKIKITNKEKITFPIRGYSDFLKRYHVEKTYNGMEIGAIIKSILDEFVLPNSLITYDSSDIDVSDFAVDTIKFDVSVSSAIQTLIELAGDFEWGVDHNLKFYFKRSATQIERVFKYVTDINVHEPISDYTGIKNKIYIRGNDGFRTVTKSTQSINLYGLREEVVTNSSITTKIVGQRYASGILSQKSTPANRNRFVIVDNDVWFEQTLPIGLMSIAELPMTTPPKVCDAKICNDYFSGLCKYPVDSIQYTLENGKTTTSIDVGEPRPNLINDFKRLEFQIENIGNIV